METYSKICYKILLCTIVKETEHESIWIVYFGGHFIQRNQAGVAYNAVS